jgi:hypothetical protein
VPADDGELAQVDEDVREHRRTGRRAEGPTFGPTRGENRVKALRGSGVSVRSATSTPGVL